MPQFLFLQFVPMSRLRAPAEGQRTRSYSRFATITATADLPNPESPATRQSRCLLEIA